MADNFSIKTPHAAVLIWTYVDRIGSEGMTSDPMSSGVKYPDAVEPKLISSLSLISIQTSKTKAQPEGTFNIVLAPTKDWISVLTPGSWICIMMGNEPITEKDVGRANKRLVKMIGKIETVRTEVSVGDDGARNTRFTVSGVDWCHIFNSVIYVDNLIAGPNEPLTQGNSVAIAMRNLLFGKDNVPKSFHVNDNLRSIINIFGQTLDGIEKEGRSINRLASALYNFRIPKEVGSFFNFVDIKGKPISNVNVNKLLNLVTGALKKHDTYTPTYESKGFIDPFSLQGQHSFWQVLMDNSNPALNEMFAEMRWNNTSDSNHSLGLCVYNRIRPFSFKNYNPEGGAGTGFKSFFQNCREHYLNPNEVISLNAGTNWRDKFNFIEIKPDFQDFNVIANWTKQKCQVSDSKAFPREGFRPLIMATKQFPSAGDNKSIDVDFNQLEKWLLVMREWYFNTHRMLNGTIVLHGISDYIGVGDNISFDLGLLTPTPNINKDTAKSQTNDDKYILAHVESVSHSFSITPDGARTYITTIQFVRGITVYGDNVVVGSGPLDKYADGVRAGLADKNTKNVISTSVPEDPDTKGKLKGT